MAKLDYLSEVNGTTRKLVMFFLLIATLVSASCFFLAVALAIVGPKDVPAGPLLCSIAIFGLLTFVSGWFLIRLLLHLKANNQKTVMPETFIQLFGVVFLIGICVTAISDGIWWLFGEGVAIAGAMIGIRRLLRESSQDSGVNV